MVHPLHIKEPSLSDSEDIKGIHIQAFDESDDQIIADFAVNLLKEKSFPKPISLIAIQNDEIVGHIAFSPVFLVENDEHFAYILAPLAISPEYQKAKIGSILVKHGLDCISNIGSYLVFVYGDSNYYSRFGFQTNLAVNFIPPYPLKYPEGWLALKINDTHFPEGGRIKCVDSLYNPELW